MIRVTVHLLSAVTGQATELARMDIYNDGEATLQNHRVGDYGCQTYTGRNSKSLDRAVVQRRGSVKA